MPCSWHGRSERAPLQPVGSAGGAFALRRCLEGSAERVLLVLGVCRAGWGGQPAGLYSPTSRRAATATPLPRCQRIPTASHRCLPLHTCHRPPRVCCRPTVWRKSCWRSVGGWMCWWPERELIPTPARLTSWRETRMAGMQLLGGQGESRRRRVVGWVRRGSGWGRGAAAHPLLHARAGCSALCRCHIEPPPLACPAAAGSMCWRPCA